MKPSRLIAVFSLLILIWVVFLLTTSAEVLEYALWQEPLIPVGTLITWIGFIALPALFFFGDRSLSYPNSRMGRLFSFVFKFLLILGLTYGPICYYLAGNWSFNFGASESFRGSSEAGRIFWQFNFALAGLSLLSYTLYRMLRILLRIMD